MWLASMVVRSTCPMILSLTVCTKCTQPINSIDRLRLPEFCQSFNANNPCQATSQVMITTRWVKTHNTCPQAESTLLATLPSNKSGSRDKVASKNKKFGEIKRRNRLGGKSSRANLITQGRAAQGHRALEKGGKKSCFA
ncbi:hypothetical protein F5B19DRAFT_464680 [Rostrohypoxylon terebratum]|nr:hypothetical protein F5B19DRAFT_464680 [Rostrohypoxylon terebratum]